MEERNPAGRYKILPSTKSGLGGNDGSPAQRWLAMRAKADYEIGARSTGASASVAARAELASRLGSGLDFPSHQYQAFAAMGMADALSEPLAALIAGEAGPSADTTNEGGTAGAGGLWMLGDLPASIGVGRLMARIEQRASDSEGRSPLLRSEIAQVLVNEKSYTQDKRELLLRVLCPSDPEIEFEGLQRLGPYQEVGSADQGSLLSYAPDDQQAAVLDIFHISRQELLARSGGGLAAAMFFEFPAYLFDHPILRASHPDGGFDGFTLLIPARVIGEQMLTKDPVANGIKALTRFCDAVMGEFAPHASSRPAILPPGGWLSEFLAAGAVKPAQKLYSEPGWGEMERAGLSLQELAWAVSERVVARGEGWGSSRANPFALPKPGQTEAGDGKLLRAVWRGDMPRVQELLDEGASATARDPLSADMPLGLAAMRGDLAALMRLLALSDPNALNARGENALMLAIKHAPEQQLQSVCEALAPRTNLQIRAPNSSMAEDLIKPRSEQLASLLKGIRVASQEQGELQAIMGFRKENRPSGASPRTRKGL